MTTIQSIPLSKLHLGPKNSRKHRSKASIAALAESLRVNGQLQNLVVTGPTEDGRFEVNAGGTRFLAFSLRADTGEIPTDHPVDCKVIAPEGAREASLAENTLREAMHPADQFRAFRALVDEGKSVAEVAAHFSITPTVVEQRLKLANVAPDLFEIYEKGDMKLDQLQALALTDDHEAQRRGWNGVKGAKVEHEWQRRPAEIRKRITSKEIGPDNKLVGFVGVDLYESAGGTVRRDMFSNDVYFSDRKLLETLAGRKLEAMAEVERAAGWSWVECHLDMDYSAHAKYGHSGFNADKRAFTAEEQKRLKEIEDRATQLHQARRNASGDDFERAGDELQDLASERDAIRSGAERWSKKAKEQCGVLIYIDQHRGLQIERARLKPGQRLTQGKKAAGGKDPAPKKPELSADMVTRLEMHQTAAIRYAVASAPQNTFVLVISQLAARLLTTTSAGGIFNLDPTNEHEEARGLIASKFKDVGASPARKALDQLISGLRDSGMPSKASEMEAWVSKLPQDGQIAFLALLVSMTIPTVRGQRGITVADAFGVDMRTWWKATPENFTSLVPKAMLALAVGEVEGKPAAAKLLLQDKAGATAQATQALANSGWLPKPLRGAAYQKAEAPAKAAPAAGVAAKAGKTAPAKTPQPKEAAAKKAAPAKKAAAKKPAKKAAPKKAAKVGKK